jgi:hypothetical protein
VMGEIVGSVIACEASDCVGDETNNRCYSSATGIRVDENKLGTRLEF